jgi:hypothetical protein
VVWPAAADDLDPGGRNAFLKTEIAQLDVKIKDIADLKAEIEALKARQNAVENLQTDRNVPVYLLNELVKQTPEGVYLTTVRQLGTVVTLTGKAETNERVSEFLRNTFTTRPGSSGLNWWKSRQRPIRQDAGPPPSVRLLHEGLHQAACWCRGCGQQARCRQTRWQASAQVGGVVRL